MMQGKTINLVFELCYYYCYYGIYLVIATTTRIYYMNVSSVSRVEVHFAQKRNSNELCQNSSGVKMNGFRYFLCSIVSFLVC